MSLTTASQLTHRARCARAAAATLAPSQQTRTFRFAFRGVWSLGSESQREDCRRQRALHYRYAESINRGLAWEKPLAEDARSAIRNSMNSYWNAGGRARIHGGRYVDMDAARAVHDNPRGVRPGRNIEDAERAPMESLLFGDEGSVPEYIIDPITNRKVPNPSSSRTLEGRGATPRSTLGSYQSLFTPFSAAPLEDQQAPIFYDGAPPEAELAKYAQVQIDAEPWEPASRNGPHTTIVQSTPGWGYRGVSWHRNDGIASSAGSRITFWQAPQADELSRYKAVEQEESDETDKSASDPAPPKDLGQYKAIRADEPDGKYKAQSSNQPAQEYDDLDKYGAVRSHEPDGKYKSQAVVDPVHEYKDLGQYKAVRAHEPDGKYKVLGAEDPTQEYEDLGKYGAVRAHEPDGKYKVRAVQDATEEYSDLSKYGAIRAHEPDGKYKVHAVQDPTQEYDDLHTYKAFRAHEPDGKYKIEAVAVKPEALSHLAQDACLQAHESETFQELVDKNPGSQYHDLKKYGPVRAHEPDGLYKIQAVEDPTKEYDDLHKYGAYRSHEPDGMYKIEAVEDPTKEYSDLDKYIAFRSHEPDGKYAASYVEPKKPRELGGYRAFRSHEPDGKYAAESNAESEAAPEELGTYRPFRSHEPDGKYAASHAEPAPDKQELGTYKAYRSHEPDGKYAAAHHDSVEQPQDLKAYGAFRSHEPDGKYANREPDATPSSPGSGKEAPELHKSKYGAVRHHDSRGMPLTDPAENHSNSTPPRISSAVGRNEPDGTAVDPTPSELQQKTDYRNMLESLMARIAAESDAEDLEAAAFVKQLKEKEDAQKKQEENNDQGPLTGSYVRDFPEDFTRTWSADGTAAGESLLPSDMESTIAKDQEPAPSSAAHYARQTGALQPSLDRQNRRLALDDETRRSLQDDPYSREPQGLQTSYQEETAGACTWPTLVKHYAKTEPADGAAGTKSDAPAETAQAPATLQEPVLYKILAYDSIMQRVEVAETTSVVPDQATPLTPAEVLLRLSNPSKFFPYFGPLQTDGFEIVSGSGGVLVFRKVHTPNSIRQSFVGRAGSGTTSSLGKNPPVNPIDMTGGRPELPRVAADRFASPTGFVNYDLPSSPPPTRFVSGLDVRREEPVFSGAKDKEDAKGSKPSLPKRAIVSALWLGGALYSIGVMGEYFSTGGSDGKGPRGL